MMESVYKGESPGKKLGRREFWDRSVLLAPDKLFDGPNLFFASAEGGDASTLAAMGVDWKSMVAVDIDEQALVAFSQKFPHVRTHSGDVTKIVRKHYQRALGSVFLDFCGPLSKKVMETIFWTAVNGLRDGSVLGYAVMRGRERRPTTDGVERVREGLDSRFQEVFEEEELELDSIHQRYIDRFGQRGEERAEYDALRTLAMKGATARVMLVAEMFLGRGLPFRMHLSRPSVVLYHSRRDGKGVPMMAVAHKVYREPSWSSEKAFLRRRQEMLREEMEDSEEVMRWVAEVSKDPKVISADDFPVELRRRMDFFMHDVDRRIPPGADPEEFNDRLLRLMATNSELGKKIDMALLYNLPRQTLAAWKAHRTMGSYDHPIALLGDD